MESNQLLHDDWNAIIELLPSNWQELAQETKALTRRPKKFFYSASNILRTLLLHVGKGYSLRETSARAREHKISIASDVGILKALRRSEIWLQSLCVELYRENINTIPAVKDKITMRLVDGTIVKEPGKTGSLWRIHYSITLPNLSCDYFQITKNIGNNSGESFKRYPIKCHDCIIGDRNYSHSEGIAYIEAKLAYSIVRVNTWTLPFYDLLGNKIKLLDAVNTITSVGELSEWLVNVKTQGGQIISGRLCIKRKTEQAARKAIKTAIRDSSRKGKIIQKSTLEYAKYIIIFTTLPQKLFSKEEVLEWYKVRWQIELTFKKLKSLAGLGHLPKYDDQSSRAWLYEKLLLALLTVKLIKKANNRIFKKCAV